MSTYLVSILNGSACLKALFLFQAALLDRFMTKAFMMKVLAAKILTIKRMFLKNRAAKSSILSSSLILGIGLMSVVSFSSAMPLQHGISLTPKKASEIDITDYYVSEKLDGIRGYWDGSTLFSRQGYAIVAPDWFTENLGERPLDGEIWLGRETFQALSGLIARNDVMDPLWSQVTYQIFDLPAEKGTFKARVALMQTYLSHLAVDNPHVKMVDQFRLPSNAALDQQLKETLMQGGEGLMLHHEAALYRPYIRHDALLKVKEVDDGCAIIRGFTAGKGKYATMVGALEVETIVDGEIKSFRIGSGLTDAMRLSPPEIGTIVTYLHNGFTQKGIPRFPRIAQINVEDCAPEKIYLEKSADFQGGKV